MALSQVSLGFWEVDLGEGHYMACTDQCKRNFGWDTDSTFSYENMLACIIPEDLLQMQEAVGKAVVEKTPYFAQYRVRHPDGSLHWIEANGSVIYDEGRPVKIIGTTVNITKTKGLEILRDELLSVAMHELKTPLSVVKSSLQIMDRYLHKHGDEKISNISSLALGSADRITRLLNDIAEPVLVQSQEIVLTKTRFELDKLIQEISANAGMLYTDKIFSVHVPEDVIIYADRYRIGQVLTNLINNAVKYAPTEPVVEIRLETTGDQVKVQVKDKGVGILEEDRMKIFKKFYRAGDKTKAEGLGIGLFICSEIILQHRGKIAVENNDQPGTTIFFILPINVD